MRRIETQEDLKSWFDGYDTAIRYVDDQVGKIVEWLKAAEVYEDTAIILSADHGENQGELGIYGEHGTADAATCRVPLIVRWPGAEGGRVDRDLHYHLDVAPTLADLLGFEASPCWDGQSFAASALGEGEGEEGREALILSQCAHVCQRSARWGDWLYMRTYHDGYHLFPREMLYNLADDPHEQRDLASERPDLLREGLRHLQSWHDERMDQLAEEGYDSDPLWTVMKEGGPFHARGQLPDYIDRLVATGRAQGAEELKRRHAREL